MEEVGFDWIFDVFQDKDGMMWFASMGSGLWKYDPHKNLFKKYTHEEGKENTLSSNSVSSVMQDCKAVFGFLRIVVVFVVIILKRMILLLFLSKTVYQMMWLIRSWKMNNQIYGLEQIVDWLDLIRNQKIYGCIPLKMVY